MKPKEALMLLDKVTSRIPLSREDHAMLIKALECLKELLPKEE